MQFSKFARRNSGESGIVSLMEDLGNALNLNPDILFLGGGNPAHIPEFEQLISDELIKIAKQPAQLHKLLGVYQSPQGDEGLIDALVSYYRKELAWDISKKNIAIANGSQSAFFILLNLLTGEAGAEGGRNKVCFPLMPEYLGYADQFISDNACYGFKPQIELMPNKQFKYHVDLKNLSLQENTAALCVSRPSNPTGNIISSSELEALHKRSCDGNIPLIVDCAYGEPFPGICYEQVESLWQPGMVFVQSLSKLGMPGARTGIVIADEELISTFVEINTVISLANGNFGPVVARELLKESRINSLRDNIILPFYKQKRDFMIETVKKYFADIHYYMHVSQGAFFVWLWFPELSETSQELYLCCKEKGLLIMPGEPFFFGLDEPWPHAKQCVRLSFCQSEAVIDEAIQLLAQEVRR